ncbi:alpha-glucan family phosphorylase [Dermabacter vaginalis]|uniref:alpha-glucan family phosphorylase n=1 Tax=Dermabacter vaginalis TaxID=1630135 RepID=UPI0021A5B7CC|nr:alpha-glucan family phosphorylase [Dermabacter vaginalis]MCT2149093.1 alpha-glucan family phosphorylase [Dermabacter vaginalis]
MKALRTLSVTSELPAELEGLRTLAYNLRWTWNAETRDLFEVLDPRAFEESNRNPVVQLGMVPARRYSEVAADPEFRAALDARLADLENYMSSDRWFQKEAPGSPAIAYFSMEFGISPTLPIYSGGLGILAGDHLKSASDLGVDLIGVGLLYQWGYFSQSLNREGWQQENYKQNVTEDLAVVPVTDADGDQVCVNVTFPGERIVTIALWKAQVGRISLLLLDTNVDGNDEGARQITDRLYGGDHFHRIEQEIVLGIGGVRAVERFAELEGRRERDVFHLNEGHAGFLGLERIGQLMGKGLSFDAALTQTRAGSVFTTHTPVPAGIDRFDAGQLRHFLDADGNGISRLVPNLPVEAALALGVEDGGHVFNMAHMGFRLSQRSNGVAKLHGETSRRMFKDLYPGFDEAEVPITSITNGVHRRTWISRPMDALYKSVFGDVDLSALSDWSALGTLSDESLLEVRNTLRTNLVERAREDVRRSWVRRGAHPGELGWVDSVLDPNVLTIGFARRVSTYKRLTLMLSQPERLRKILLNEERPVQIVVAGKAHPADYPGKEFMQRLVQFADDHGVRHRIVFLADYDIRMAQYLVSGSDVWLNNPIRPEEASGTSGMKVALNGGLTFSTSDGWWDEMATDDAGWMIDTVDIEDRAERDRLEAESLYNILENRIVPLFYDRDENGIPAKWLQMVRNSLVEIAPKVTATRMVRDYVNELYAPASKAVALFANEPGLSHDFAEYKQRLAQGWGGVSIHDVEDSVDGDVLAVSASVELASINVEDVEVQLIVGNVNDEGDLTDTIVAPMTQGVDGRYAASRQLESLGAVGYTVRVVPSHRVLAHTAELGLVRVAQ